MMLLLTKNKSLTAGGARFRTALHHVFCFDLRVSDFELPGVVLLVQLFDSGDVLLNDPGSRQDGDDDRSDRHVDVDLVGHRET